MTWQAADFLARFVVPLVRGGDVHVAAPLSVGDVLKLERDLPHAAVEIEAIDDARMAVISEIAVSPPAVMFGPDELSLAAAVHNLLFLVHPRIHERSLTGKLESKVLLAASALAAGSPPSDRSEVLANHGLLHNLFAIARTDTTITWWTGSAVFRGQAPPPRLTTWPTMRRVRQDRSVVGFGQLFGALEKLPVVAQLCARTPLTHVLATSSSAPPLVWEDAVVVLRDADMARVVCQAALGPREPRAKVALPARYAAAFDDMLERGPDTDDARAVAAFLVHLNALLVLAEVGSDGDRPSALIDAVLAPDRAASRPRGLVTWLALPQALANDFPKLSAPPGIADDPALAACWSRHRRQVADAVGDAVIDALADRVRNALMLQ